MDIAGELDAISTKFGVSAHLSRIHKSHYDAQGSTKEWCAETTCAGSDAVEFTIRDDTAVGAMVKLILCLQLCEAEKGGE